MTVLNYHRAYAAGDIAIRLYHRFNEHFIFLPVPPSELRGSIATTGFPSHKR